MRLPIVIWLVAAGTLAASPARAQAWPTRTIRFVSPLAPGGAADVLGRAVANQLSADLKQSVVVESHRGGGGIAAAGLIARAASDGYTLFLGTAGIMTITPVLTKDLPYDPIADFTPLTIAVENPICLVVHKSLPVDNVAQLVAYAKAHPGELSFGSSGTNTSQHLAGADCKVILRDIEAVAPSTLCSLFAGVNWDDPAYGADWRGIDNVKAFSKQQLLKAIADGHFFQPDRFMPGMNKIGRRAAQLNGGHVFNLNGLDSRSLSDGMIEGRRRAVEYTEFFRKYVPGCEEIQLLTTAPVMGVRDTRRIVGEFELTIDDFRSARQLIRWRSTTARPTWSASGLGSRAYRTRGGRRSGAARSPDWRISGLLARGTVVLEYNLKEPPRRIQKGRPWTDELS